MSTAGKSTKINQQGFTLFELIMVIAILAIAAGVVVPNINLNIGKDGIDDAVQCVQTVLDQGRTHAKLIREEVAIVFEPDSISILSSGKGLAFPESARFTGIVFAGDDVPDGNELIINRRGIVPATIVRLKVNSQIYSVFIGPVLRGVKYRKGVAGFDDFIAD